MHAMIRIIMNIMVIIMNIMLNHNNFKILNPLMPDRETETEIQDNETETHPTEEVEETARQCHLMKCLLPDLIEMARDALIKLK